jgi:hypothetical protein
MTLRLWMYGFLLIFAAAGAARVQAQTVGRRTVDPVLAKMGGGFTSDTVEANGTALHYVHGGAGPAIC